MKASLVAKALHRFKTWAAENAHAFDGDPVPHISARLADLERRVRELEEMPQTEEQRGAAKLQSPPGFCVNS